ncbi:hypothetical protein IW261DRAFT_1574492 [Armillaria novae-zelandiae]|uniref:Uncharacterized protein n=1 Tax=Armillaria novae-zelandiae TaxID=153914 RepID=A0AA39NJ26_9AGAR|nr:hypothetical protein IW261DRAFT_1574492 [Armillaria novae-zelandiae]
MLVNAFMLLHSSPVCLSHYKYLWGQILSRKDGRKLSEHGQAELSKSLSTAFYSRLIADVPTITISSFFSLLTVISSVTVFELDGVAAGHLGV